jgi:hypothetical protein
MAIDRSSMSLFSGAEVAAQPGSCEVTDIRHMPMFAEGFPDCHAF